VTDVASGLVLILVLGVSAQWLAWRMQLPSILLLFAFGVLAGPVTGFVEPDVLFGRLLFPVVSLGVAVILFEGGLSLRISDLRRDGAAVWRLVTIAAAVTWVLASATAYYVAGFGKELSILIGAILIVTGPTVIVPLLRQLRLKRSVASVLKWEGMLNDPLGAVLAVLVFEGILAGTLEEATSITLIGLGRSFVVGSFVGVTVAAVLAFLIARYYVPDFLQNPVTLAAVGTAYVTAHHLQHESGLLAVTLMGLVLSAQRWVPVRAILQFKENLRTLLISSLFVVLAARLEFSTIVTVAKPGLIFLAALVLVVRPVSVLVATVGSKLTWPERVMLMCMAPRGIVAAAVASVFALRLRAEGYEQAHLLVPTMFLVIAGTIVVYALPAPWIARKLGVAASSPQGVLFLGAAPWVRAIAKVLQKEGIRVQLVDDNFFNVRAARMDNLPARYGNVVSERLIDEIDLDGIGYVIAMTPNEEANSLATLHFADMFERSALFQLAGDEEIDASRAVPRHLRGRLVFAKPMTYRALSERFSAGATVKRTPLTEEFGFDKYREMYGESATPLFLLGENGRLQVIATDASPAPKPGHVLVSLLDPEREKQEGPA